ncbi:MAG: glycosyltransferase family 2 protein [Planctomycetes bacterium]|nr:glycosyltransferase family 2 protein [Planctomycetota bacterium]
MRRRWLRRWRLRDRLISFVVPAHDEEALVGAAVESLQRAARELGRPFEIIVVDDASTDRTAAVAAAAGARVVAADVRQISRARNAGAAAANGEYLIFMDADTIATPAVVRAAVAALDAGAVGGGGAARFDEPVPRWGKAVLWLVLRLNRLFRVAAGCFVFCRRDAFERVGGFDPALFAGEEIAFTRRLGRLRAGRFVSLREHVVTSGRKLRTFSGRQILRELARVAFLGRRGVRQRESLGIWYGPRRPDVR